MIASKERKIYLSWQPGDHQSRYIVAELIEREDGHYCFRYIQGRELENAKDHGFQGYPAFTDLDKEYTVKAIEPFVMRLPSKTREDFSDLLTYWEIRNSDISDFDLLAITGARLRTDNFEFIDPHKTKRPTQFLTELTGFFYYVEGEKLRTIPIGAQLLLAPEPENKWDPHAVRVIYDGNQIGYIKKVHAQTISEEIAKGRKVKAEINNLNVNGVVNSVLLKITISE